MADFVRYAKLEWSRLPWWSTAGGPAIVTLKNAFDMARPFKTHYVIDPTAAPSNRRDITATRYAGSHAGVEVRSVPLRDILLEWTSLYDELVSLRRITASSGHVHGFDALADCDGVVASSRVRRAELGHAPMDSAMEPLSGATWPPPMLRLCEWRGLCGLRLLHTPLRDT
jgi:hypothetical protein